MSLFKGLHFQRIDWPIARYNVLHLMIGAVLSQAMFWTIAVIYTALHCSDIGKLTMRH